MIGFLILAIVLFCVVGGYFYFFFRRFLTLFDKTKFYKNESHEKEFQKTEFSKTERREKSSARSTRVSRLLSILFGAVCAASCVWIYGLPAVIVLHFFAFSILSDIIVTVICRVHGKEKMSVWGERIYKSGIISVVAVVLVVVYGFYNIGHIVQTDYRLETNKTLNGKIRIAQISDLHMGTTMDEQELAEYCTQIEEQDADMLLLTGDIVDELTTRAEMEAAVTALASIDTTYGSFYVFGNHDYNEYTSEPYYTADELRETLTQSGIIVLEDEAYEVTDTITVIGRTDASHARASLADLMPANTEDTLVIVMDHQPVDYVENASLGVDFEFSGHTHAGQIWPTGQLTELVGAVSRNYGHCRIGDYQAIVSSGIAGWGYAIRTGGHSEYVIADILTAQ